MRGTTANSELLARRKGRAYAALKASKGEETTPPGGVRGRTRQSHFSEGPNAKQPNSIGETAELCPNRAWSGSGAGSGAGRHGAACQRRTHTGRQCNAGSQNANLGAASAPEGANPTHPPNENRPRKRVQTALKSHARFGGFVVVVSEPQTDSKSINQPSKRKRFWPRTLPAGALPEPFALLTKEKPKKNQLKTKEKPKKKIILKTLNWFQTDFDSQLNKNKIVFSRKKNRKNPLKTLNLFNKTF